MGQLIAIAIVSALGVTGTAATILTAVIGTLASFALSTIASAIMGKPKSSSVKSTGQTVTVRDTVTARRIVYGRERVGGVMAFAGLTGTNTSFLHVIVMHCSHEIDAFEGLWFGNEQVTLDGNGDATGKYAGFVRARFHTGKWDQVADADLVAESAKWTSAHRLRGIAYTYLRLKQSNKLFPSGLPDVSCLLRGRKAFDHRDGTQDPESESTWKWTTNAIVNTVDYARGVPQRGGDGTLMRRLGLGILDADIQWDSVDAAANVSAEAVALAGGGTEARYQACGIVATDVKPGQILQNMLSACAGKAIPIGGLWYFFAGAYDAPSGDPLTLRDTRAPYRTSTRISGRDRFNSVRGVFVGAASLYEPTDFPPVSSSAHVAEDGRELWHDIELPYTPTAAAAQRLAMIEIKRARQEISVTLPCKLSAMRALTGSTIGLTIEKMGWDDKPFDVVSWTMVPYKDRAGAPALGIDIVARETSPSAYDWTSADEIIVDDAPNTELPDYTVVAAPTGLLLAAGSAELLELNEGSILSQILATWDPPAEGLIRRHEVQAKIDTATSWLPVGTAPDDTPRLIISPVQDGATYQVRVRAVSVLGVPSDWSDVASIMVLGKAEPPPDVDDFRVTRLPDGTRRFTWRLDVVPADVRSGGGYRIKYKAGVETDWDAMSLLTTGLLTHSPFETNELAAGVYTLAIKVVDSSGHESPAGLFINATLGDPRLKNVLLARYEFDEGWPGTKTDAFVDDDGYLKATSSLTWDDLPSTWSALPDTWDEIEVNDSPIAYETPVLDLGVDVSFTPIVSLDGETTLDVQFRTGTAADGTVTGSYVTLATVAGRRYVQFEITAAGDAPVLRNVVVFIDSETVEETYEDVDTATATDDWFESAAAGDFKIGSKEGAISAVSQASLVLQNVGGAWTWELVSKAETVGGFPAVRFKVRNALGILDDALVDVTLKGPKS